MNLFSQLLCPISRYRKEVFVPIYSGGELPWYPVMGLPCRAICKLGRNSKCQFNISESWINSSSSDITSRWRRNGKVRWGGDDDERGMEVGRKEKEDKCIFYIQIAVSNRKGDGERGRARRAPLAERIHNKFQMSAKLEVIAWCCVCWTHSSQLP